jgi:hypothetical protein
VAEAARIVDRIRGAWPRVRILLRVASGFAQDELLAWCEANAIDYVFGLARNARLVAELEPDLVAAAATHAETGRRGASRSSATPRWTAGAAHAA